MAAGANLRPLLRELHDASAEPEEKKYYKLLQLILTEPDLPTNQPSLNNLFRRYEIPQKNGFEYHIQSDILFTLAVDIKSDLEKLATMYPDVNQQRNILRVLIDKLTGEGIKSFENRGVKFIQFLSLLLRKRYTPEQLQQILENSQLYTTLLTHNKDWTMAISEDNRGNRNALFQSYTRNQTPFVELLVSLYNEDKGRLGPDQAKEKLVNRIWYSLSQRTRNTPDIIKEILREYIGAEADELVFNVDVVDLYGGQCKVEKLVDYMCEVTGRTVPFCPATIKDYGPQINGSPNILPEICQKAGGRRKSRKSRKSRRKTRRRIARRKI
jgi:hypothetical protein